MKKTVSIILFCLIFTLRGVSINATPELDTGATVSIITCGAGNEFYTTFGHSAIHIQDTVSGIDVVYNYGTFDFDTPHFYLTFARGRLNYCLSRTSYLDFLMEYTLEGRAVWEQELLLTQQEKQNLFVFLETNYLPEYRYYRYDLLRDNCATRVRDAVNNILVHRNLFETTIPSHPQTYRELLTQSTGETLRWWQLGVDIVLGARCDNPCNNQEYMFLPVELMRQLDTTRLSDTHQPLAKPARQILKEDRTPLSRSISPTVSFWVLFVIVTSITIIGWKKKWSLKWMDVLLFLVAGLASVVILFLWFCSEHYCTVFNLNILWASPLYLYLAIFPRKHNRYVVYLQTALFACLTIVAAIGVQTFNEAIIPIALILFIRTINILVLKK